MRPDFGRLKVSTRLIRVLFPAPEDPTRAVVEPAAARNEMCFTTSAPGTYSKVTLSNATSPAARRGGGGRRVRQCDLRVRARRGGGEAHLVPRGARAPSSASSVTSRRIS